MEIINSENVTDDQISLLKKGFEFVPSRKKSWIYTVNNRSADLGT